MRSALFWNPMLRKITKERLSKCKFGCVECKEKIILIPEVCLEGKLLENYVNFYSIYSVTDSLLSSAFW
jgi:hypothetical protein